MTWFAKIRLRVLAYVGGVVLAALGLISLTTLPAWGIWGVAVAAVAMVVHRTTGRLGQPTCYGCGISIEHLPEGEHGVICHECGTICVKPRSDVKAPHAHRHASIGHDVKQG